MNRLKLLITTSLATLCAIFSLMSQPSAMQNVMGRQRESLNGKWYAITDQMDIGLKQKWGAPTTARNTEKLRELYFEGGMTLDVPGDWNSQNPEFVYYEAPMWYKRNFNYTPQPNSRQFLHFAAVCTNSMVYLNGELLGEHKGGFTPFQFEVTGKLNEGHNHIVVRVDNTRRVDNIPALGFDWWNYGGITRDVDLISTPETFIEDYWLRLSKGSMKQVDVDVKLNGERSANQEVVVSLKGTKISRKIKTNSEGVAKLSFDADLELWSPENPHLYDVVVTSAEDQVEDKIGFRSLSVEGCDILLNGEPIFLRGVNIHEEIAIDRRRSTNEADAEFLTNEALDLGCNFIRLSHYPHNEYMVKMCERKGIMMWEEIPVWQAIDFTDQKVCNNATNMMHEMVARDKNRCGIIIWSVSNETFRANKSRNEFLPSLVKSVREWDNTRAVSSALNGSFYKDGDNTKLVLDDPLMEHLDIIGINKYMGWYDAWKADPSKTEFVTLDNKPMIVSEFGAEAIYANYGDGENLNAWSEDYMKKAYEDDLAAFENTPNFRGSAPWILFDFRSPRRAHAMYQQGWNRKGLISPEGNRKQAWYVMRDFYQSKTK
ncbi:MAG: glycoside hydrolase family 2 TIM barrel-domain containing protein [Rikenellaceae bacterium]